MQPVPPMHIFSQTLQHALAAISAQAKLQPHKVMVLAGLYGAALGVRMLVRMNHSLVSLYNKRI